MKSISLPHQYVAQSEIAELFGVGRPAVSNWQVRDSTFPAPLFHVGAGPVWHVHDILNWGLATGRLPAGTTVTIAKHY